MEAIGDMLRRGTRRHGGRVALRFEDRAWRYSELDQAVSRVASGLLRLGLSHGDRVAALGRNSDAYVLLFLGCARAGLVHVPVNYNLVGEELAYLLTQSGAVAAFGDPEFIDTLDEGVGRPGGLTVGTLHGGDRDSDVLRWSYESGLESEALPDVDERDLAQLLYTSGTTAKPKGAMMTHRALMHNYVSCVVAYSLHEREVALSALALYHSAPLHCLAMPHLLVGAELLVLEEAKPQEIVRRIEQDAVTGFFAVPTLWSALLEEPGFARADLSSLRKAYYGASIMPQSVLERLRKQLPDAGLYQGFGQSEMGPLTTVLLPDEHVQRPTSAGRPVLFVQLRVVDGEMRDVQIGEPGEVVYRSEQACVGYWQKPEETREAFAGGWFHSGDLVRQDDEGYIYVIDRIKDVINTGGVLVASREVEDALLSHPGVREAAVVATPDAKWVEAITAFVVPRGDLDENALLAHAREHLSGFKVPKTVRVVDELPRNAVGKVLKRELRPLAESPASGTARAER